MVSVMGRCGIHFGKYAHRGLGSRWAYLSTVFLCVIEITLRLGIGVYTSCMSWSAIFSSELSFSILMSLSLTISRHSGVAPTPRDAAPSAGTPSPRGERSSRGDLRIILPSGGSEQGAGEGKKQT